MKYVVMRRPVFMEDEGRHFFEAVYETRKEAEDWIAAQKDEYYKPNDYYIAEGPKA